MPQSRKRSSLFHTPDFESERDLLPRLFADARRDVGCIVARPERADDVFQDAMLVLLLRLRRGELNDPAAAKQFVHGVARRIEANARRKELRRRMTTGVPDSLRDSAPSALTTLLREERARAVRAALAALHPKRDRSILYRLYLLDQDRDLIRGDLGLTARAFDRLLSRARSRLRRALAVRGFRASRQ